MMIVRYASGESEQKCACHVLNQPISLTILALESDSRTGSSRQIGHFRNVCLFTWARFLKVPKLKFSHSESQSKNSNFMTTELFYWHLYNNQINARALIGQSAVGNCADKPTEKSLVLSYYNKAIDHKFLWVI